MYQVLCFDWFGTLYVPPRFASNHKLYPEAQTLLNDCLSLGCKLVIATTSSSTTLKQMLDVFGLRSSISAIYTGDCYPNKPDPAMLLTVLTDFALTTKDVLMIGDSRVDVLMAERAGIDSIGLMQNGSSYSELQAGTTVAILSSLGELCSWLKSYGEKKHESTIA